jgi:hypothetical protein
MVGLKRLLLLIVLFSGNFFLFCQTDVHGKVELSTGFLHLNTPLLTDTWVSGSLTTIRIQHSTPIVKASIECSSSLSAAPFSYEGFSHLFSVDKAYFKTRIPFFNSSFMQASIGKMPVSWGYGLVYNAGDILFAENPSASLLSSLTDIGSLRSFTDWAFLLYIPAGDFASVETIFMPPLEPLHIDEHITRSALRIQVLPYARFLESAELGANLQNNIRLNKIDAVKLYAGIDGTIFADYNLCSSIEFSQDEGKTISFSKNKWLISAAVFYSFWKIGLRTELLYHPLTESADVFCMLNFSILEPLNAQAAYNYSNTDISLINENNDTHFLSAGLNWTPVKGFSLSFLAAINIKEPDNFTSVMLSGSYSF